MVAVGWTLASITGLLVVFGVQSYNHFLQPTQYEVMTSVVYGGGHRLAWGTALAWVVFACHNGYGGNVCLECVCIYLVVLYRAQAKAHIVLSP